MTQQPESTDPIASAGQIDDPDQPTTVHGEDDSRAGRDTQPDEGAADGDPDQRGMIHRSAPASGVRTVRDADGATVASAARGTEHDDRADHDGKPPKAVQETGFPVVGESTVDAQGAREVDSESRAATRKFQPRPGEEDPNISEKPEDRLDVPSGADRNGTTQQGDPEGSPTVEPVRHSRLVEERVQEQERDFDLGTTEDGERYLTPRDTPGV